MDDFRLLTNLLLYRPGHSGFSRYVQRVVPFLPGHRLILADSSEQALRTQSSPLPDQLPRSRRLRLLQGLTLAQHGISVRKILKAQGPMPFDVIYSPFSDYLFECGRCPQVITCHDLTPLSFPGSNRSRLRYQLWTPLHLRQADHVVAISSFVADQLLALGVPFSAISVVPNGVEVLRPPVLSPGSYDWLLLARHDRNKNIDHALKGFSLFLQRVPDWPGSMVIVGRPGRETPLLLRLVRDLGLACRVKLIDVIDDAGMISLLRSSYGLLSVSRMEGFDYPVLESKAEGVPTLISDIPVHREFHSGSSLFFPLDRDGSGLAHCMNELANSSQGWRRLSILGLECARQLSLQRQVGGIKAVLCQFQG